jgi:hypothetical protein
VEATHIVVDEICTSLLHDIEVLGRARGPDLHSGSTEVEVNS